MTLPAEPVLDLGRISGLQLPTHRVLALPEDEIDTVAVRRWRALAERSCEGNAFLLPEFVIPSWKHLSPGEEHVLVVVEHPRDRSWLAAGIFRRGRFTSRIPVPHAVSSHGRHTYRSGLLWDVERGAGALDSLLRFLAQSEQHGTGLELHGLRLDSRLARELEAAARRQKLLWQANCQRQVPAVFPQIVSPEYIEKHWSKNRRKSHRRHRAQLEKHGEVSLHFSRSPREVEVALQTFLRLEAESWKGQAGTACLSNAADEDFVREMVSGLALHGNVIISELRSGSRVMASALNLVAGTAFFAFKIGWDREFTSAGPGILHECELLLQSSERLAEFTILDSCAGEDSYLADYWPERIPVGQVAICWSPVSELALHLSNVARSMKRLICSMW